METFVGEVVKELMADGISVEFTKRKRCSKHGYNYFYDGSFPEYGTKKILKINFYNDSLEENYGILVHEYCHYKQWKDKSPLWEASSKAHRRLDRWLNGKIKRLAIEDIRRIQKLELDCDKRAIALIKEKKLLIDINEYIRESNVYILLYNMVFMLNDFYIASLYSNKELQQFVPNYHINNHELGIICPKFIEYVKDKYNSQ